MTVKSYKARGYAREAMRNMVLGPIATNTYTLAVEDPDTRLYWIDDSTLYTAFEGVISPCDNLKVSHLSSCNGWTIYMIYVNTDAE